MTHILLIGCGNMGRALLARWREDMRVTVIDPVAPEATVKQLCDLPADHRADMVVLAVKPQQLGALLPELKKHVGSATLLTIAAGKTIAYYEQQLGSDTPIVRAMPNTPAMIGQGMTAMVGNNALTPKGHALATRLMESAGKILWLEDEALMDAVTAVSGSGPAYVFAMLEGLVAAGMQQGLGEEEARLLAVQTTLGSAALALSDTQPLAQLRQNVTSPGGTTAAALSVLQKNDTLSRLLEEAVAAAVKRARELA